MFSRAARSAGRKQGMSLMNMSSPDAEFNSEITRSFALPQSYRVTFRWKPPNEFEIGWSPDPRRMRKARAWQKLFAAYQAARREFLEEVAALIGGAVLVLDTNLKAVVGTDIIHSPTRH